MTFEEIQAEFKTKGVHLSADLWILYRRRGLVPDPINAEGAEFPPDAAPEAAAAMAMFVARRTVNEVKIAREIGRLVLRNRFVKPETPLEDEPQLRDLLVGRPAPAVLAVDWIEAFLEYLNVPLAERPDSLALSIDLMRMALDKEKIIARRDQMRAVLFPKPTPPADSKQVRRERLEKMERAIKEETPPAKKKQKGKK